MSLTPLTKLEALTTKCSLVDLSILRSTEWHTIVLKLKEKQQQYIYSNLCCVNISEVDSIV